MDEGTVDPFSGVTVSDTTGENDSATVVLLEDSTATDADGFLSGTGLAKTGTGTYALASTSPAGLTAALRALVFTPTAHQAQAGATIITAFGLAVAETGGVGSATDGTTSVIATAVTDTPTITGTTADQATTDLVPIQPFSGVTIADPDFSVMPTVTISLRSGGIATDANGVLSGTGLSKTGVGTYTITDTPTTLTSEIRALSFVPTHDQVALGQIVYTKLDLQAADGLVFASNLTTSVITADVACYCRGTLILTERGEVPVEELAIGDRLVTVDLSAKPIRWIGWRSYSGVFLACNHAAHPVRFAAGSLSPGVPRRDLLVSPEHAMFLGGKLVPARALLNGSTIAQVHDLPRVDYFHVELAAHDVIWAEGAASETFIDDDSRGLFHNAAGYAATYRDEDLGAREFCAERVESGEVLEAIRERLAAVSPRAITMRNAVIDHTRPHCTEIATGITGVRLASAYG
jgi:hypothetical protein